MILQEALGLRPSELLGITGDDVMLPEDRAQEVFMPAVIGLGIKHGTKAKRAQTVMLASPIKVALLRWLKSRAPGAQPLVGYTYSGYRNVLKDTCERSGLGMLVLHHTRHAQALPRIAWQLAWGSPAHVNLEGGSQRPACVRTLT